MSNVEGSPETGGTAPGGASRGGGRLLLAVAGLVLALVSPVFWMLTLDNNFLQRTGLMMWVGMGVGLVLVGVAAMQDRRKRTRLVAGATFAWVVFAAVGCAVFTQLPAPQEQAAQAEIASFTLPDHTGTPVALADLVQDEAALLVFYRGHW